MLMPFVEMEALDDLDEETIHIMKETYGGSLFLRRFMVKWIDRSAINRKLYLNTLRDYSDGYMPENPLEIAEHYILKLDALCNERGIHLHLLPGPVSEEKREEMMRIKEMYEQSPLHRLNPNFFEDIYYFPAEQAGDSIHFSGEYDTREHLNSVIRKMLTDDELMGALKLE